MKMTLRASAVVLLSMLASGAWAQDGSDRTVTEAQYEQWKTELTNWGRWGADDEIGALNLITPAKRLEAVALVEEGFTVSLAGDADTVEAVDNPRPYQHEMVGISSDRISESPQTRVGRGGANSMPPQQRNSIEMSAPCEWNP